MREVSESAMWVGQDMFRGLVQDFVKRSLSAIGVEAAPESHLVGFRSEDESICIASKSSALTSEHFADVETEAHRRFEVVNEPNILITDAGQHDRYLAGALESCRLETIKKIFSDSDDARHFFVGYSGLVGDYRVYPILSVLKSRWASYPELQREQSNSRVVTRSSLQAALVQYVLDQVQEKLSRRLPPEGSPLEFDERMREDTIRHAAQDFVGRIVFVHGDWNGSDFFTAMNAVAAQPYEGRTGVGTIILAKQDHPHVDIEIKFSESVSLDNTRSFRKVLEMTGRDLHLLSDGVHAFGLGRKSPAYSPADESAYLAKVVGRGAWELSHEDLPLLRVENGHTKLPRARLSEEKFIDAVDRVFGSDGDAKALWKLSLAAAEQLHGTMLVIHSDAASEADRLSPPALAIEPGHLAPDALYSLTAIDGAVLVSPDGRCHAVGVILDGTAVSGSGDGARGARFNSAVRYQRAAAAGSCVIVIISEDGMIDLLPNLKRQVKRSDVELVVTALETASRGVVDFDAAQISNERLYPLEFYLNADQCTRVNTSRERIEDAREALDGTFRRFGWDEVSVDPEMNDSYFFDD